jgi:6,7-dimethyl-8-ribityllumazine synthase
MVTIATTGDASRLHVGVAVASWNKTVTDRLLDGAVKRLEQLGVGRVTVMPVPGSLELPLAAKALASAGCHAVVALGTIVKGETDHYSIVSAESARGLSLVALELQVPVANGVLAVHDITQAVERAEPGPANKGYEAATAAVEMALEIGSLAGTDRT